MTVSGIVVVHIDSSHISEVVEHGQNDMNWAYFKSSDSQIPRVSHCCCDSCS